MASIIPGYEYDIFVSYRQKDNKYDGWVTEFVNNLKSELESTFKEEIGVYFDMNPHDGLLDSHDVDESLREKLKCLVFIPIISRTYCDPKSFSWEREFKAFIENASRDRFGLKVKLQGGNIAARILPVQIHDIIAEDRALIEKELGGALRAIEFIYKEPGVNRPLAPADDDKRNINKTRYRNQINKVANSLEAIISSLKNLQTGQIKTSEPHFPPVTESILKSDNPAGTIKQKAHNASLKITIVASVLLCLLGAFSIFAIINNGKKTKNLNNLDKTIAVLPFHNLSKDTTQIYFCDGMMEEILNDLQKIRIFTVRPRTSSDQYRETKKSSTVIGNELKVNYLVGGNVEREGNNLRIWVHLIDSKADKQIWSNEYNRQMRQIFSLQSEIAQDIALELKTVLSPEEKEHIEKKPTENLEAYNYYLQGNYYLWKSFAYEDMNSAVESYKKVIDLDPQFAAAYAKLAGTLLFEYWNFEDRSKDILLKSKQAIDKAFELDQDLPEAHIALGIYYYFGFLKYEQALEQFEIVLNDQPKNSEAIFMCANVHRRAGNWEAAGSEFKKASELDPRSAALAEGAGELNDLLRNYPEAYKYYSISLVFDPDWIEPRIFLSQIYIKWKGDLNKAKEILNTEPDNKSDKDPIKAESNFLISLFDGKYEEALSQLSQCKAKAFQNQFYYRPKYLYYATIYGLMNKTELQHSYYDSTRVFLEKIIDKSPDDYRAHSALGIAFAGLGQERRAIEEAEKAIQMIPVSKDAFRGTFLVENLALVYVMSGKYEKAIDQVKYLLSIPGFLSTNILEMDPRWAPIRNQPEFRKLLNKYSIN